MTVERPKAPYLGARLRALFELIEQSQAGDSPYHTLWDCCCDHGYLGIKLLHRGLCEHLHFNDQVPHLIEELEVRLSRYPADTLPSYSATADNASNLKLNEDRTHLVILAGVGGEHMINILEPLLNNNQKQTIDFLFCPATTQFDLRDFLESNSFSLMHESLVTERNRDYEIIHARWMGSAESARVSKTGQFWRADNDIHKRYLRKLVLHYQRCTQGPEQKKAQRVLGFYLPLWQTLYNEPFQ